MRIPLLVSTALYDVLRTDGELLAWLPPDSSPAEIAGAVAQHLPTDSQQE